MSKWIFRIVLLLILSVIALVASLSVLVDPNQFKPVIKEKIYEQSQLTVDFDGDIALKFFPSLSLKINKVKLNHERDNIAHIEQLSFGLPLIKTIQLLITKNNQISTDALSIKGLTLNIFEKQDGQLNIASIMNDSQPKSDADAAANSEQDNNQALESMMSKITFSDITIEDTQIDYRDKTKQHYQFNIDRLAAKNINIKNENTAYFEGSVLIHDAAQTLIASVTTQKALTIKSHIESQSISLSTLSLIALLPNAIEQQDMSITFDAPNIKYNLNDAMVHSASNRINASTPKSKLINGDMTLNNISFNVDTMSATLGEISYALLASLTDSPSIDVKGGLNNISAQLNSNKLVIADHTIKGKITDPSMNVPFTVSINNTSVNLDSFDVSTAQINIDSALPLTENQSPTPLTASITQLSYQHDQQRVSAKKISTKMLDLASDISLKSAVLSPDIAINADIKTNTFNGLSLLSKISPESVSSLPKKSLERVQISTSVSYTPQIASAKNIIATIDDTTLRGNVTAKGLPQMNVSGQLFIDSINIDRYISTTSSSTATKAPQGSINKNEELLPIELLKMLNVNLALKIQSLTARKQKIKNINCALKTQKNALTLKPCSLTIYGGNITLNSKINTQTPTSITLESSAKNFNIDTLSQLLLNKSIANGSLNMTMKSNLKGNTITSWLDSNSTQAQLNMRRMSIKNVNLHGLLNDYLGEDFKSIISNYAKAKSIRLPQAKSEHTEFDDIDSKISMSGSTITLNDVSGTLKNGDGVKGKAHYNIANKKFDSTLYVKIASHATHPHLNNIEWPLHCSGLISASPKTWCKLTNKKELTDITKKIAKRAAKIKTQQLLSKKLGIEIDPNQSIEQAAKKEMKKQIEKKIEDKIDKDKIKEKAQKEAGKLLQGLFK
jgi:uncharacterized protein involved in outer membrane biogenesis